MASILVLADARRDVRHGVDLPCWVVREVDSQLMSRHAVDLSPNGIRVSVSRIDIQVGDRFFVCFLARALGPWFYTDAVAARLLCGRRSGESCRSLALLFTSLSTASSDSVRGALRGVPPLLPQREARIDYAATVERIRACA
jgi:hypothetical protein